VSFDALFHRLYPSLFRYAYRLTGDTDAADDAAQESFVRLLGQAVPHERADAWLFTVVTNLVRQRGNKASRQKRLLTAWPPAPEALPAPDQMAEQHEREARVRAALDALPERDRQMLLLRQEGMSYAEIAAAAGVAPGSVGTLLARALDRFAKTYGTDQEG
jgi:RNA polymerase sigma-70 factor (ECF subfamily)